MARRAYNATVARVRSGERPNFIALRNAFAKEPPPPWATGAHAVNSLIAAGAVKQAVDAYATNFAKKKKNPTHTFEVGYRSHRRTYTETIKIEKRYQGKASPLLKFAPTAYTKRAECHAFFGSNLKAVGGIRLQDKPHVIERLVAEGSWLKEDAKIHFDKRTSSFHLIYTYQQPKLADPDPEWKQKRIVATDPGVAAFQTTYSPTSGTYGELLEGFGEQIEARILRIDALHSRVDRRSKDVPQGCNRTKRQRYLTTRSLRRRLARERRRHVGWLQAAHYDAANYLLRDHDLVLLPKLHTGELCMRNGRRLRKETSRKMLTMSHYQFRQRVAHASTRYAGRHMIETEEPGTSKTCTNCGCWKASLSLTNRIYDCARCKVSVGRDIAGARNNFFAAYGKAVGIGWDGRDG